MKQIIITLLILSSVKQTLGESLADPGVLPPQPMLEQSKKCDIATCYIYADTGGNLSQLVINRDGFKKSSESTCDAYFEFNGKKYGANYTIWSSNYHFGSSAGIFTVKGNNQFDKRVLIANVSSQTIKVDEALIEARSEIFEISCYP